MENVESIYPLSAAQRGILLRMLRAPGLREYVEQVEWTLRGPYDGAAFEAAWRHVVARHPVLRSAFFWEGLDEPVQVVRRGAALPVERLDWRGVPAAGREERFRALEREDRARGF
ncbi:MAG TPA: condensation domain-containing protein, partial [Longimicrobiaceae bacterium]